MTRKSRNFPNNTVWAQSKQTLRDAWSKFAKFNSLFLSNSNFPLINWTYFFAKKIQYQGTLSISILLKKILIFNSCQKPSSFKKHRYYTNVSVRNAFLILILDNASENYLNMLYTICKILSLKKYLQLKVNKLSGFFHTHFERTIFVYKI